MSIAAIKTLPALVVLVPFFLTSSLTPIYLKWQKTRQKTDLNYEGKEVVSAGGLVILISFFPLLIPFHSYPGGYRFDWRLLLVYLAGIGLLGAVDDFWGEKDCKGFKGHLQKLFSGGGISTGLFKACGGFLHGIFISSFLGGSLWPEWLLKGTFLALFSNFFNLLDTRPARAAKVFLSLSLVFMFFGREYCLLLIPFWSALCGYLFWELKAEVMLGDTGAYLLGGALGFNGLLIFPPGAILAAVISLIFLHLYCEKFSLGDFVEGKKSLLYLDRLGRRN